eukprot:scaffold25153_cov68-Phaeocystis_antarctica.AAC.2
MHSSNITRPCHQRNAAPTWPRRSSPSPLRCRSPPTTSPIAHPLPPATRTDARRTTARCSTVRACAPTPAPVPRHTDRSSTSGAATRARTGSPSITTAPRTSRCSRRAAGPRTPHSAPNEQTPADHTGLQPWASRHTPSRSCSATHTCEPRLGQAQRPRARRGRRDGGQPEHVARVLLTPTPTLTLDLTLTLFQP